MKIVVHVAQALVSQHQATGTIDLESKRAAWTTIEALVGLDEFDAIVGEGPQPSSKRDRPLTHFRGGAPWRSRTSSIVTRP